MSEMYNGLNEDYMFLVMHDRVTQLNEQHRKAAARGERRWWRKAAPVAR